GAGLGTSPELMGPGVNRLGAGPGLDCTGAICLVSSDTNCSILDIITQARDDGLAT
ncbi:hypothetical protein Tco_0036876, partial [Tanacetum coccineum]